MKLKLNTNRVHATVKKSLIVAVSFLLAGCSVFGIHGEEEIEYTVIAKDEKFEVRKYAPYIKAYTNIKSNYKDSGRIGFNRLFDYISGNNQAKEKISMTAPVILYPSVVQDEAVKISMTAPVLISENSEGWEYSFVMPSSFTYENTPTPLDSTVKIMLVEEKTVAVLKFNGILDKDDYAEKSIELKKWLNQNNYKIISGAYMAGFDPPWTLPMFRRNEMMIDIEP